MKTAGNFLWIFCGGLLLALVWVIVGCACMITIFGIPMGFQCFKFAAFVAWPFGRTIAYGNNLGSYLVNVLWIMTFGWILAGIALVYGILLCVTVIGIPFGMQFFKFSKLALMPFGTSIIKS